MSIKSQCFKWIGMGLACGLWLIFCLTVFIIMKLPDHYYTLKPNNDYQVSWLNPYLDKGYDYAFYHLTQNKVGLAPLFYRDKIFIDFTKSEFNFDDLLLGKSRNLWSIGPKVISLNILNNDDSAVVMPVQNQKRITALDIETPLSLDYHGYSVSLILASWIYD